LRLYLPAEPGVLRNLQFELSEAMAGRIPNVSTRIVPKNIALPETGSCFDTTAVTHKVRSEAIIVPQARRRLTRFVFRLEQRRTAEKVNDAAHISAFSLSKASKPHTTDSFLRRGQGTGGSVDLEKAVKV